MTGARGAAAAVALCALAAAGCGLGPGSSNGEAELTVTRDYGAKVLTRQSDQVNESDTVIRMLDRNADLQTRYGGGFVQSIDGLSGGVDSGRSFDWFFYVNGIESPIGSADYRPGGGDRIWWDYRDWTSAMRVPAVVGSFPEPFLHGFQGTEWPVELGCFSPDRSCKTVRSKLGEAGVAEIGVAEPGSEGDAARVLVGPWARIASDPAARLLAGGPERSGVFARFEGPPGDPALALLDQRGDTEVRACSGAGLIAAVRPGDGSPTWVVTGTDLAGVEAAATEFGPELRDRYAVAAVERGNGDVSLLSVPAVDGAALPGASGCPKGAA